MKDFMWTAGVEATFLDGISLPSDFDDLMFEQLDGRVPAIGRDQIRARVFFALDGESRQAAQNESENLVKRALGAIGVGWLEVTCISVTHNALLQDAISRIDPVTGHLGSDGGFLTHPEEN